MLRFAAVLALFACATLALAFVSYDPGPSPLPEDPDNRGTFRFAIPNDPGSMDPGRTSASTDFRVVKCIYEPLLVNKWTSDASGGLEPGTAESWTLSGDKLTYTFSLRQDAKWSDGEPVTADDFVFGWRRAMIKETAGKYYSLFDIIEGAAEFKKWRNAMVNEGNFKAAFEDKDEERAAFLKKYPKFEKQLAMSPEAKWKLALKAFDERVGIKALDKYTLEVKLASPASFFADLCAFPTFSPLPRHVLEPLAKIDEAGWYLPDDYFGSPGKLVTNGPYTLSEWRRKVRMVFDQNPHYWNKDAMGNIRVVQETIPDPSLQLLRYERGLLDWIPNVTGAVKQKLVEIDYKDVHIIDNAGTYYYEFNCRPTLPNGVANPMTDPLVRRALGMCINREQIVQRVTKMNERQALLMVPDADITGYIGPIESGVPYDPEGARKLLADAGFPGGQGFPPIVITVNNDAGPGHANIALPIKKNWEDVLGINVTLEQIEFKVLLERATKGNFFVRRAGWFGDYADPTTWLDMYRVGDSNNDAEYENPAYDELLKQAAVEPDADKRFALLNQAEAILMRDAPIVPIFYYATVMVYDDEKIDLRPNAWNNLRLDMVPVKRD